MTDQNNAAQPEPHPLPWSVLPADKAELFEGADMWFFNDANGEEVFYGCAMSIAVRDLILEAVNRPALLSKLRAPVADERAQLHAIVALADEIFPCLTIIDKREGVASGATEKIHDLAIAIKRAALASAPVAGEARPFAVLAVHKCGEIRSYSTGQALADAPIQDHERELQRKYGYELVTVYAAPQASEAVRQCVPPEKPLPDLMMASYHEAIGWNACRAAMLKSAALSAQPGAQKVGGDA